jgi:hypothetical protein
MSNKRNAKKTNANKNKCQLEQMLIRKTFIRT